MKYELAIVMPVYNEEECIAGVVRCWREKLAGLNIHFLMIVLNDGSIDNTAAALEEFSNDKRIVIVNKPNSGHGPAILQGYHQAVELAQWVFQCDSDNEITPESFPALWEQRDGYDAIFGCRTGRKQNPGRKIISIISRATVRMLFKNGVKDVNVPYRLMRSDILRRIILQIPPDTFAPNLIISGAIARANLRICNIPVPHRIRQTGTTSIVKWKLWKAAFRSFWQVIGYRR